MTSPRADRVASIAAELGRLGRRLDELGAELLTVRADTVRADLAPADTEPPAGLGPAWSAPPAGLGPAWPSPPVPQRGGPVPAPYRGAPASYPGAPDPGAPRGPVAPRPVPARARLASLSGARVLAWTGAAVTLLGVVLFLALAAARGWFAPPVRVGAGALLGLGLVGAGLRMHRRPASRTGALAVTGTGIATLYLVVAAATALYGYLPVPAGLLLALLVAGGGLGLADRWRSALLGTGAVVGAALLAPVVTERLEPLLVGLVLVLQAAATVVGVRRRWPVLVGVAAVWPVLYGTLVAAFTLPAHLGGMPAAAVAVLLLDVAAAGWTGRGTAADGSRLLPVGLRIGLVVAAPVPALTFADAVQGATLAFAAAALLLGAAALPGRDRAFRVAALATGALALLVGTGVALDGDVRTAVVLGQGVALLVVAAVLRSRPVVVTGALYAAVGVQAALSGPVPPSALASFPAAPFVVGPTAPVTAVIVSVLVLAAAVAALVASARAGLMGADAQAAPLWAPLGLVGLYGAAGLVISLALLVSPTRSGFVVGHAVVTVSWTLVALVLLARGIRRPALRVAGLVLVAASVAKLVFFDLLALDGLARVGAFLGAGLLLLAAGTRYARLVAEAEADAPVEPAATSRT